MDNISIILYQYLILQNDTSLAMHFVIVLEIKI